MQTMPETEVGPAKDIEKEKDSAMANQFKDYVALKKEIMSLKLQVRFQLRLALDCDLREVVLMLTM